MNGSARLVGLLCLVTLSTLAARPAGGQVLLRDDFLGDTLDTTKWEYAPTERQHGLSFMQLLPTVGGGVVTFEHHTTGSGNPDVPCRGGEILSVMQFQPDWSKYSALEFEARVRFRTNGVGGVVSGFFTYMDKPNPNPLPERMSDEIDMEFLSNQVETFPDLVGHHAVLASYNEFKGDWYDGVTHWHTNPNAVSLDLTDFNVFKFRWMIGGVEWYWTRTDGTDVLLAWTPDAVPADDAVKLYFNIWASDRLWPLAWHSELDPITKTVGAPDRVNYFDVDYVEVRAVPEPATTLLFLLALPLLRRRRGADREGGGKSPNNR